MGMVNFFQWPNAIVMLANYKAFRPGETFHYPQVQSRYFVWCKSGRGKITANHREVTFLPGTWLFLPWFHRIDYEPDDLEPFILGCIHLIPDLAPGSELYYEIFHQPEPQSPLFQARHDQSLEGFDAVYQGWAANDSPLLLLGEYIVNSFRQIPHSETQLRYLAALLLYELQLSHGIHNPPEHASQEHPGGYYPLSLQLMLNAIEVAQSMGEEITIEHLTRYADCSSASVYRLFRHYMHTTPLHWIMNRKMTQAAQLLLLTTLPVSEIGKRVGIADPYYFSKLFKKYLGISAAGYRINRGLSKNDRHHTTA